ncbi:MAG TPA: MFS transporter [Spirochaetes bacterium]|nr:MFS transporter [Spirochaetota bacterium]
MKRFYGWYLIAVLWFVYFTNLGFVYYGGNLVNTFMVKELGMSRSTLGLGYTIFMYLQGGFMGPLIALVINKKGIRFSLALGCFLVFTGSLLMATWVSGKAGYFAVFGVMMGLGVGFGGILPVQTGAALWFKRKRALALSIVLTAAGIGGFAAAPSITALIGMSGGSWRHGWLGVALFAGISFFLSLLFVRNRPSDLGQAPDGGETAPAREVSPSAPGVHRTDRVWTLKEALSTGALWCVFIGIICLLVPYTFCVGHGVIHLLDRGFSRELASLSLGLVTLFSIAGRLVGGVLGDRFEPRKIWAAAMLVCCGGLTAIMNAHSPMSVYLYAGLLGTGFGMAFVQLPAMVANYYGADALPTVLGTLSPVYAVFTATAPFAAGLLYDTVGGYGAAFAGSIVLLLAGTAALLMARPPAETASR